MTIEKAVDAIISDLRDRQGLKQEWDRIDEEIRDEIRQKWIQVLATPSCPNCHGTRTVTWRHDDGDELTSRCPECAEEK